MFLYHAFDHSDVLLLMLNLLGAAVFLYFLCSLKRSCQHVAYKTRAIYTRWKLTQGCVLATVSGAVPSYFQVNGDLSARLGSLHGQGIVSDHFLFSIWILLLSGLGLRRLSRLLIIVAMFSGIRTTWGQPSPDFSDLAPFPVVEVGVSSHPCNDFWWEIDTVFLHRRLCRALPVLDSPGGMMSVLTNSWTRTADISIVLVFESTDEDPCGGPLITTLWYENQCQTFARRPAGALLISLDTETAWHLTTFLLAVAQRSWICINVPPIQHTTLPSPPQFPMCQRLPVPLIRLSGTGIHGISSSSGMIPYQV